MIDLNGNDNYNSGNGNNYGSNGYNNNGYNNSGYNNYGSNSYNNNYNNSYGSSSYSSVPARTSNSGSGKFLIVIFAIVALLFIVVSLGNDLTKIRNCKERTKGTVVSVTQVKERVRKKNHSSSRYRYRYKAKVAYTVNNETFTLDVPKTSYRFRESASETVYYNKSNPSESYSESYMDHKKTSSLSTVAILIIAGIFSTVSKNRRRM